MNRKLKLRITKCYLVEVVDENGYVQEVENDYGQLEIAEDYCFGTKEEAKQLGESLIKWVEKQTNDEN